MPRKNKRERKEREKSFETVDFCLRFRPNSLKFWVVKHFKLGDYMEALLIGAKKLGFPGHLQDMRISGWPNSDQI